MLWAVCYILVFHHFLICISYSGSVLDWKPCVFLTDWLEWRGSRDHNPPYLTTLYLVFILIIILILAITLMLILLILAMMEGSSWADSSGKSGSQEASGDAPTSQHSITARALCICSTLHFVFVVLCILYLRYFLFCIVYLWYFLFCVLFWGTFYFYFVFVLLSSLYFVFVATHIQYLAQNWTIMYNIFERRKLHHCTVDQEYRGAFWRGCIEIANREYFEEKNYFRKTIWSLNCIEIVNLAKCKEGKRQWKSFTSSAENFIAEMWMLTRSWSSFDLTFINCSRYSNSRLESNWVLTNAIEWGISVYIYTYY